MGPKGLFSSPFYVSLFFSPEPNGGKCHFPPCYPSNMRKKSKGTTKCEKRTVTCNVGTAQYKDKTINCEKKIREPPNVM